MDYHKEFLNKLREAIKIYTSETLFLQYGILERMINIFDKEKFNSHIERSFYQNTISINFDECFEDFHKLLRQADVLNSADHDMLLWYYISSNGCFYNICERVIKGDKNYKFYNSKFDIWNDD